MRLRPSTARPFTTPHRGSRRRSVGRPRKAALNPAHRRSSRAVFDRDRSGGTGLPVVTGFVAGELEFYDFAARASRRIAEIDRPVQNVSPDDRSVVLTRIDRQDSDLMMLKVR
jgi:hypothetical protein